MYAHHPSYHLEPRTLGLALSRGVFGHKILEEFYEDLRLGSNYSDAVEKSLTNLASRAALEVTIGDSEKGKMYVALGDTMKQYFAETDKMLGNYEIVGVEHLLITPLPNSDINFAGKVDLLLKISNGPYAGYVEPWDHKFTYDFWSEQALDLNPQISNYTWAIEQLGMKVKQGVINMVRYRDNAIEKFKQYPVTAKKIIQRTFIEDHKEAAEEIVELKTKPVERLKRSASKFNCQYCIFATLCNAQLNGVDTTLMQKANFRPNSYGYDSELDVT